MIAGQTLAVARRYAAAAASGDDDEMRTLCDPKVEIWHNTDGVTQTIDDNIRLGRWLRRKVPGIAFTEVRHTVTDDGFVQRHRMRGDLPGGRSGDAGLDVHSCLVVTLSEAGRILRVEEYLDSAALSPLTSASGSGRGSH